MIGKGVVAMASLGTLCFVLALLREYDFFIQSRYQRVNRNQACLPSTLAGVC